ncbi:MAG: carbohydrate-binding domain-containing protein [Anaerolineaceae bacterium]|nr:carbohydrate-binding domain-containing protein [Anaerolineaceae bacterium]
MKKKMLSILLLCSLSLAFLAGCGSSNSAVVDNTGAAVENTTGVTSAVADSLDNSAEASGSASSMQDMREDTETVAYTSTSENINLSDYAANSIVTITAAGDYTLTGSLTNGQVVVSVGDEDEVYLYLNNVEITNSSGSAILVENAKEVVLNLVDGTVNKITDAANYANLDENGDPDAAIFSHDDLTITGSGSLAVQANYYNGIESRDDLKITSGNISVTAVNTGLFGNNSVEIEAAVLAITSGGDSIHSDGDILVESGSLTISSGDDGMHADGAITANGGMINVLQSYEGIEATDVTINGGTINIVAGDDGINGAGGNDNSSDNGFPGDNFSGSQCSITINGGTITITAGTSGNGDSLDANGTITITGGDTVIVQPSTYRDYTNIDYNTSFSLTGGTVRILQPNGTYTEVTESYSSGGPMGGGGGRR